MRYRARTRIREALPAALTARIPKGGRDCGHHEWYRVDAGTWRCYHCRPGVSPVNPWTEAEQREHDSELERVRAQVAGASQSKPRTRIAR